MEGLVVIKVLVGVVVEIKTGPSGKVADVAKEPEDSDGIADVVIITGETEKGGTAVVAGCNDKKEELALWDVTFKVTVGALEVAGKAVGDIGASSTGGLVAL